MSYFQTRGPVFTFSPDSTVQNRSEHFYNTWVDLFADIVAVPGERTIVFDNVNNAAIIDADIPAGTYDMDKITLMGPSGGSRQGLAIGTGVSFPHMFNVARNIILDYTSAAAALCTVDDAVTAMFLTLADNCLVNATSSRPIWQFDSNVTYTFNVSGGCRVGSPATFSDSIKTNGTGGGVTLNLIFDGASFIIPAPVLEGNAVDTLNVTLRDSLSSVPDFSAEGFGTVNVTDAAALSIETFGATGDIADDSTLVLATTGGITLTLPVAATVGAGFVVYIKDRDGNAAVDPVTIEGDGAETIDGNLTFPVDSNYQSVTLVSDGSNWSVL